MALVYRITSAPRRNSRPARRSNSGDRAGAELAYEQALSIREDFVEARLGLGLVQGESGKMEAALRSIDMALGYAPEHLQARVNLGADALQLAAAFELGQEIAKVGIFHATSVRQCDPIQRRSVNIRQKTIVICTRLSIGLHAK